MEAAGNYKTYNTAPSPETHKRETKTGSELVRGVERRDDSRLATE